MRIFNTSTLFVASVLALCAGSDAVAHAPRAKHIGARRSSDGPQHLPVLVWLEWSDRPAAAGDCAKVGGTVGPVGTDSGPLTCVVTPADTETSAAACRRVFHLLPDARCVPRRPLKTAARDNASQ